MTTAENADPQPKRSWNSSTKLTQPRRAVATVGQAQETPQPSRRGRGRADGRTRNSRPTEEDANDDSEQRALTRELLERAVSTAFGGLLQASTLDATAFPDGLESEASEMASIRDKENAPPEDSPVTKVESKLHNVLKESSSLSTGYRRRRHEHQGALQQATSDAKAAREFQRRMKHAAFEHRERKMAVQALQARIQREIQFLSATAADLEKREFLLDEAFESYDHALRLELGLSPSSNQQQVEASPRRSY